MKRTISLLLCVTMILSLCPSAFAVNTDIEVTEYYEDEVIDESSYIVDESQLTHTPYTPPSEDEIPVERPTGLVIRDNPEDGMSTYSTRAVYGPYTGLETMADEKMQVVVNGLKSSGSLNVVSYAGYNCYKFVSGGNTVYVTCDAFYRQQNAKPTRSISSDATTAINNRDTSTKYTTLIRSYQYTYNGNTVYRWSFARVGVETFHAKNNSELVMSVDVIQAYDFDAYPYSLQDIGAATMKVKPTMAIRVTNSGNGIYFDSYEFRGLGENTTSTTLGNIVNVAYTTSKMIGTVASSSLSVGTVLNLFNEALNLTKSTSSNRKSYLTDIKPLSSSNKYLYKFETPVPYSLKLNNDYSTMELGITGTVTSATQYNAYYGWTIS